MLRGRSDSRTRDKNFVLCGFGNDSLFGLPVPKTLKLKYLFYVESLVDSQCCYCTLKIVPKHNWRLRIRNRAKQKV